MPLALTAVDMSVVEGAYPDLDSRVFDGFVNNSMGEN